MTTKADVLLGLRGVTHHYGRVLALDAVDLDIRAGEVHAVIGENGSGKTTLVNIAGGQIRPDQGEIIWRGHPVRLNSRSQSASMGVGVVHQHLSLVGQLSVAENLLLGRPKSPRILDLDAARADADEWSKRLGLEINADATVDSLPLGTRQHVEIVTALSWGAEVLMLDEPTAVLGPTECAAVLATISALRDNGVGVLLISHKMREVAEVADRITVLRTGRVVGEHRIEDVTEAILAREMIGDGRTIQMVTRTRPQDGAVRLVLDNVHGAGLNGLSLDVKAGEIVGVAGVAGNGQEGLVLAIAGLAPVQSGKVEVGGFDVTSAPRAAMERGIAVIPEDRARDALAPSLSLWKNSIARATSHDPFKARIRLSRQSAFDWCYRVLDRMGVKPRKPTLLLSALSGGNQQRLLVGRELEASPSVVIAAEPTRGLDPSGAVQVAEQVAAAASEGSAVLLLSSDLDEVLALADRVMVIYRGRIVEEWPVDEVDLERLSLAMAGASNNQA